jgi:hypothetical protein
MAARGWAVSGSRCHSSSRRWRSREQVCWTPRKSEFLEAPSLRRSSARPSYASAFIRRDEMERCHERKHDAALNGVEMRFGLICFSLVAGDECPIPRVVLLRELIAKGNYRQVSLDLNAAGGAERPLFHGGSRRRRPSRGSRARPTVRHHLEDAAQRTPYNSNWKEQQLSEDDGARLRRTPPNIERCYRSCSALSPPSQVERANNVISTARVRVTCIYALESARFGPAAYFSTRTRSTVTRPPPVIISSRIGSSRSTCD